MRTLLRPGISAVRIGTLLVVALAVGFVAAGCRAGNQGMQEGGQPPAQVQPPAGGQPSAGGESPAGGQKSTAGGQPSTAGSRPAAPAPSLADATEASIPAGYKAIQNPIALGDAAAIAAGKQIAVQHCIVCHAADFRGMQLDGVHSGDLTESAGRRSEQFLMWAISAGSQRGMPPWERALSAEKRWQLVTFIKSLKK